MKIYILLISIIIITIFVSSCGNKKKIDEPVSTDIVNNTNTADGNTKGNLPVFDFEKKEHNFGKIIEGEKVSYAFKFKNTGNADLIITAADASCGCTIPEYPKKPLSPGEEGVVKVLFNSSSRKGIQNKTITIIANTQPSTVVLKIKAMVVQP